MAQAQSWNDLAGHIDFKLDPARCAIVGDSMSDIEAGAAAGLGLRIPDRIPALPKREAAIPTP